MFKIIPTGINNFEIKYNFYLNKITKYNKINNYMDNKHTKKNKKTLKTLKKPEKPKKTIKRDIIIVDTFSSTTSSPTYLKELAT